jgi:hypothetical protein
MKVKELKQWLKMIPDDVDINYISGHGKQEITCFENSGGLRLSNTPWGCEESLSEISATEITKFLNDYNNKQQGNKIQDLEWL